MVGGAGRLLIRESLKGTCGLWRYRCLLFAEPDGGGLRIVPIWLAGCVFEAGSNVAAVEALVAERFLLLEGADADEQSDLFDDAPCVGDIEAVPGVGQLA
jgi:hypothetical protein